MTVKRRREEETKDDRFHAARPPSIIDNYRQASKTFSILSWLITNRAVCHRLYTPTHPHTHTHTQ